MSISDDVNRWHGPRKLTLASFLIYCAPILCVCWFGVAWKFVSIVGGAFGVWLSPGHLRRWFGGAFLISLFIWGAHDVKDWTWDGHPLFMFWWVMSFGTRWHSDGVMAQAQQQEADNA